MLKYFDRDFFRFLLGFVAILSTSIIIILVGRLYQEQALIEETTQTSSIIQIKNN